MICPHADCRTSFHYQPERICLQGREKAEILRSEEVLRSKQSLGGVPPLSASAFARLTTGDGNVQPYDISAYILRKAVCPECRRMVLHLEVQRRATPAADGFVIEEFLIWPQNSSGRAHCPEEVPNGIAEDYDEACRVLAISPKASAALSRRCLQHVLRDAAQVRTGDLSREIQEVLDRGDLPPAIASSIDAVRNIGNFAAHPMKSRNTGEVMPVEPGEAEWTLSVLEALFHFYYVQPSILQKNKDALNQKLSEAGKPPMK